MSEQPQFDMAQASDVVKGYRPIEQILPSHWLEDTVIANGIRQHYYHTGGTKPPVVLLHGIMEGALAWLRTARVLEQDYDVIMVDARGHGWSDRITTGFSQDLLTEDVADVIRILGLGAPRVLGFSQGAATGIHLADAHPDLVHSLIAAGMGNDETPGTNTDLTSSPGYQAWYNAWLAWLEQLKTQTHEQRMVSALSQQPPAAPIPPEDEYVTAVENAARLDLDLVRLSMTLWSDLGQRGQAMMQALGRLTCPVLIMRSSFFPTPGAPKSVEIVKSDRPNVEIVRFVNTGHLIAREQFEPYIKFIRDFFQEH
ncbi:MAG: alpha/beta hydrolase [Chloroflexi bacterium]|nr:alpha/beta hydrolase [Chloroflexota bacterium]